MESVIFAVRMTGTMSEPVIITAYDPSWPSMFVAERDRVLRVLDGFDARVEHIGSTAVPGLGSKPVIDMLVGLPSMRAVAEAAQHLGGAGYERDPNVSADPDRTFLLRREGGKRLFHAHLVETGSVTWAKHLAFRDLLRRDGGLAGAYECAKRAFATRYRDDRDGYTRAKVEFIETALASVRR
ncbi:MAG: GrpB family protein [Thermoplasmata archaeon]|nr:GrpB family protein [Thermoplasmata archaeon]